MAGSNPAAAEWIAQLPLDTGFGDGGINLEELKRVPPYILLWNCNACVCEGNGFVFACKENAEHGPHSGSFFKVDLHLGCCFPLSESHPGVDQCICVRSVVEGKYGGTKCFTEN